MCFSRSTPYTCVYSPVTAIKPRSTPTVIGPPSSRGIIFLARAQHWYDSWESAMAWIDQGFDPPSNHVVFRTVGRLWKLLQCTVRVGICVAPLCRRLWMGSVWKVKLLSEDLVRFETTWWRSSHSDMFCHPVMSSHLVKTNNQTSSHSYVSFSVPETTSLQCTCFVPLSLPTKVLSQSHSISIDCAHKLWNGWCLHLTSIDFCKNNKTQLITNVQPFKFRMRGRDSHFVEKHVLTLQNGTSEKCLQNDTKNSNDKNIQMRCTMSLCRTSARVIRLQDDGMSHKSQQSRDIL